MTKNTQTQPAKLIDSLQGVVPWSRAKLDAQRECPHRDDSGSVMCEAYRPNGMAFLKCEFCGFEQRQ